MGAEKFFVAQAKVDLRWQTMKAPQKNDMHPFKAPTWTSLMGLSPLRERFITKNISLNF